MKYKRGYYDLLVDCCTKYPSNIAVRVYENADYKTYTYSELYGVCEYITQNIQQLTCARGVVGIITERNFIIPSVMAAVHKCFTTFMFLDPKQNIDELVKKVNFKMLIFICKNALKVDFKINGKIPDRSIKIFDHKINFFNFDTNFHQNLRLKNHSFISMTSGSTGGPKHIQVPVQCIQPNVDDMTKLFEISSKDIVYFSTPLTFDPSMVEVLITCINGASLLIAPDSADILFPKNKQNGVTFWQTTPSKFFQYSDSDVEEKILSRDSTLRVLALGGEPLNGVKRLKQLKAVGNRTKIFTLYGVTEMSCWACATELDLDTLLSDREVPLGTCLSETQLAVQSSKKNKNVGKIMLMSKTRRCTVLNKRSRGSGAWLDTGDIGELKNGTVYYRGRTDDVIKRFGNKVNLQLIEATVMQCPKVKACSCIWLPTPMQLILYYSSETCSSQELSDFLKCKLDEKHWPDKVVRVDSLPVNQHGKTSKQMLSKLYKKKMESLNEHSLKVILLTELKDTLGASLTYDEVKDKNFFSLGGTSFLAISMCNRLSLKIPLLGKLILPELLSQTSTIDQILQMAESKLAAKETEKGPKVKRLKVDSRTSPTSQRSIKVKSINSQETQNLNRNSMEFGVLWSYDTGKCVDASPTLFQNGFNLYVAVGSHSGRLAVAAARSGDLEASLTLTSRIEAPIYCHNEQNQTPKGIVGTYDGTVICFSLDNCKIVWKINVGSMVKSKAVSCDKSLYVASYDGNVRCLDVKTGVIKHVIHISGQGISADLTMANNKHVLVGSLSGACACIDVASNGVLWRGVLGGPIFAAPAIFNDEQNVLFAEVNGDIHCRSVEKGTKLWKYQGAKGNVFSSIYIKEVDYQRWQMVFGCHDSHVYSVMLKNNKPSLHWKCQMTSPVYSTPTNIGDKLILSASNDGRLCVIDAESGVIVVDHILPGETFSTPAVWGEYIFIGCRNDYLYALKFSSD